MPLPRKIERTPEQETWAQARLAQTRAAMLARVPAEASRWIAAGGVGEVRGAWLTARDNGDVELARLYADALEKAGEKNPLRDDGMWTGNNLI